MLVHWDDVERERFEWEPETAAWWTDLGHAAGSVGVGRHLPDREVHTRVAGGDGVDMLVFGTRVVAELSYLPRAGRAHALGLWFDVEHGGKPPERETGGAPGGQPPPNLVRLDDVEA